MQVNKDDLDSAFQVIEAISRHNIVVSSELVPQKKVIGVCVVVFLVLLVVSMALWSWWLIGPAVSVPLSIYLSIFVYSLYNLIEFLIIFGKTQKDPFKTWESVRMQANNDLLYLQDLHHRFHIDILNYVLLEIRAERIAFEKHVRLVTGSIEKVGIFPGFLALLVTWRNSSGSFVPDGFFVFSISTLMMFFAGMQAHRQISKLDRIIMLVERAIEAKKDIGKPEPVKEI